MTQDYLSYQFEDSRAFVNSYDELPLWSASFGLLLLKHLELKKNEVVLDIGCGTGFPLLELAARLGSSCRLYGLDPWANANERAKQKIADYGLQNTEIIEGSAEKIPFADHSTDLIVSNLGINNFDKPELVFSECYRVLKTGGRLVLTTNLAGHWKLFYDIFELTLQQLHHTEALKKLKSHIEHRGTVDSVSKLFTGSGFKVNRVFEDSFDMKFVDGTAFLNHHFIKLGWLGSWKSLLPAAYLQDVFFALEENLNSHAAKAGGLVLPVPMAYIEGEKN